MSPVCARFVSRLLKDHESTNGIEESKKFFHRYKTEGCAFLDRIITIDETWISIMTPKVNRCPVE